MNTIQIDNQKSKFVSMNIGNNHVDDTALFWFKPSIQMTYITLMSVSLDTDTPAVLELQFGSPSSQTITTGLKVTHQFMLFGNVIFIINEQNTFSNTDYYKPNKNYLISQQEFNKAIDQYIQPLNNPNRVGIGLKKSSTLVIPDIFLGGKKQSSTPPNTHFIPVARWFWSTHNDIEDQYNEYIIGQTLSDTLCVNNVDHVIYTAKNALFFQTGQIHIVQHATTNEVKVVDISKEHELDNQWTIIYSCSIPDQDLINSLVKKASNDNNFKLIVDNYFTKTLPTFSVSELEWIGPNDPAAITSNLQHTANTPVGQFRIIVKYMNIIRCYIVDKMPGDIIYMMFESLDEAKTYCETKYKEKIKLCLNQSIDTTSTLPTKLQEISSFIFKHEEAFVNHFYGENGWTELVRLTFNETHCYYMILDRADDIIEHGITWAEFQQWTELLMLTQSK